MASGSVLRLDNLFTHLLDTMRGDKEHVRPAPKRAPTLTRATPGLIVAVLVWSLVFVLSVGTNGALAAALAQHLSFPPGLVDVFSSLAGERDTAQERDLSDLVVPSPGPATDGFQDSGPASFAGNGPARALSILAHIARSPNHGGLLGLDFMHALVNGHPSYVDVSAHPDAWTHGGVANLIAITNPVRPGRIVRGRSNSAVSGERSDDDGQAPAAHVEVAPYIDAPTIDSVPWAKSTPDTGPASPQTADELVTLDDALNTLAPPPTSAADDDVPPTVLEPPLGVDFAVPAAALAATSVPGPGTMGLLAGAFVAWPIAKRMRIGSTRRTRSISSPSPRD